MNYRGDYAPVDALGKTLLYAIDDVVLCEGKTYRCLQATTASPIQAASAWEFIGLGTVVSADTPPLRPAKNQMWIDGTGRIFTWTVGAAGGQWIEN